MKNDYVTLESVKKALDVNKHLIKESVILEIADLCGTWATVILLQEYEAGNKIEATGGLFVEYASNEELRFGLFAELTCCLKDYFGVMHEMYKKYNGNERYIQLLTKLLVEITSRKMLNCFDEVSLHGEMIKSVVKRTTVYSSKVVTDADGCVIDIEVYLN